MSVERSRRSNGCRIDTFRRGRSEFVTIENELVRAEICASKGAEIVELRHKPRDLNVLWQSDKEYYGAGEYVPPVASAAFLDYFVAGWQEVFPNGGAPCTFAGAQLGQHGEVALLPWRTRVVRDDPDAVEIELSVRTHRMPFSLVRRMRLEAGASRLVLDETATNLGRQTLPFMWGHHPGFGPPFVEPGCEIDLAGGTVAVPERPARRGGRLEPGSRRPWPNAGAIDGDELGLESFPGLETRSDDDFCVEAMAEGWVTVRNPRLGLAVRLDWDTGVFPHLWCWYVADGSFDYPFYGGLTHLALEPFSSPIGSLAENAERGTAPKLAAGESVSTSLSLALLDD